MYRPVICIYRLNQFLKKVYILFLCVWFMKGPCVYEFLWLTLIDCNWRNKCTAVHMNALAKLCIFFPCLNIRGLTGRNAQTLELLLECAKFNWMNWSWVKRSAYWTSNESLWPLSVIEQHQRRMNILGVVQLYFSPRNGHS